MVRRQSMLGIGGALACAVLIMQLPLTSCGGEQDQANQGQTEAAPARQPVESAATVKPIEGSAEFEQIVESSGDRLLMFDFQADWCRPCKILEPVIKEMLKRGFEKDMDEIKQQIAGVT